MDDDFRKALSYPRFRAVLVAGFPLLSVMLALVQNLRRPLVLGGRADVRKTR